MIKSSFYLITEYRGKLIHQNDAIANKRLYFIISKELEIQRVQWNYSRMPNLKRVGDLEINQDLDYQQRAWVIQRIAWVVIALVTLAGLFVSSDRPKSKSSLMVCRW